MKSTEELKSLADWLSKNSDANTIEKIRDPLLRISQQVAALEIELKVARDSAHLFLSQRIASETAGELAPKYRTFLMSLQNQLQTMVAFVERSKETATMSVVGRAALQHVQDRIERALVELRTVTAGRRDKRPV
ncbi:MAG: hypothetical protein ABI222_16685 [Opitutaceae bacterium]